MITLLSIFLVAWHKETIENMREKDYINKKSTYKEIVGMALILESFWIFLKYGVLKLFKRRKK